MKREIIFGRNISVYTNNTQRSRLPSVMTYNIETHTRFEAFSRMCVLLCLQTMHYKAL